MGVSIADGYGLTEATVFAADNNNKKRFLKHYMEGLTMTTILSNFYKHLKDNSINTPLYFDSIPITYNELNDLSDRIATLLENKNPSNEVIPIHLDKSILSVFYSRVLETEQSIYDS
jgi:long-subunit acyl-CoA synthetase (AMP-forming)